MAWLCVWVKVQILHMAQLMPLPLTISCSSKSRLVLPFWCRLARVVLDKIQEDSKTVVCVCVCDVDEHLIYLLNIPNSASQLDLKYRPNARKTTKMQ